MLFISPFVPNREAKSVFSDMPTTQRADMFDRSQLAAVKGCVKCKYAVAKAALKKSMNKNPKIGNINF